MSVPLESGTRAIEEMEGLSASAASAAHDPVEQEKEQLTESQVIEVDELTFSDTLYQSYDT